ncbi:glutathione S-transferase family protein [Zavarzinia sp. CC-PAN008]|uniref:glutathione S-transferase family protein n=1 Tax=Zavarzinia sp. CC-PAN008 TaxID=3243332 RepID=UPI003F745C66
MPTLYSLDVSPYAARVRIAARYKGIALDLAPPPEGGMKSDLYRAINPIQRLPTLVDGTLKLPESQVIVEYLEETQGGPSLLPGSPADRARARLLSRMVDLYIFVPLTVLFGQLDPSTRNEAVLKEKVGELGAALQQVEHYLVGPHAVGEAFSQADCALPTALFFITTLGPMLGVTEPLAHTPRLARYWSTIGQHPAVAPVMAEMQQGLRQLMGG